MLPVTTLSDVLNRTKADMEVPAKRLIPVAGHYTSLDGLHLHRGQLGPGSVFAANHLFGMKRRPSCGAPLAGAIAHVIHLVSKKPMCRVAAGWPVAGMANKKFSWFDSECQFIANASRESGFRMANGKPPISVTVPCASPRPASIGEANRNFLPVALRKRADFRSAHALSRAVSYIKPLHLTLLPSEWLATVRAIASRSVCRRVTSARVVLESLK